MSNKISIHKLSDGAWTNNTQSEFEDSLAFTTELRYEKYCVKFFSIRTKNENGNFIVENDSAEYVAKFYIDDELVLQLEDSFVKLFREADFAMAANVMRHTLKEIRNTQTQGEQQ